MTDKIQIDRAVVEQALEALDEADLLMEHRQNIELRRSALVALRAALEQPQVEREPSSTAGMNIAQRILHVGGRNNAAGYVEFGSVQAVEALVRQVLRDLPQQHEPLGEQEPMAWLHTDRLGGKQAFTNEPPPGLKAKCQSLVCAPQPQDDQEPVAVIGDVWTLNWVGSDPIAAVVKKHGLKIGDKLYTHPQPPRQPLTDEQITELADAHMEAFAQFVGAGEVWFEGEKEFARAIEFAHGITGEQE